MTEEMQHAMERQQISTSGMRVVYDPRCPEATPPELRATLEAAMPADAHARMQRRQQRLTSTH